jgi:hypothetical protein
MATSETTGGEFAFENGSVLGSQVLGKIIEEIRIETDPVPIHNAEDADCGKRQVWNQWEQWDRWDKGSEWQEVVRSRPCASGSREENPQVE